MHFNTFIRIFAVLALKTSKRGLDVNFGTPFYGYALNCVFGHTRDTAVIIEKAKGIYFIYIQPRKMKFTFVQINMKQVLYWKVHVSHGTVSKK